MRAPESRSTPAQRTDRAANAVALVIMGGLVGLICELIPDGFDFSDGFTLNAIVWTVLLILSALGNRQ
jgi:hypothetical protein